MVGEKADRGGVRVVFEAWVDPCFPKIPCEVADAVSPRAVAFLTFWGSYFGRNEL